MGRMIKDSDVAPVVSFAAWLVSNHDRLGITLSTPKSRLKATTGIRTRDLTLTKRPLYRLSYCGNGK